jgi:hypothetical protein
MIRLLLSLLIVITVTSCATKIDPNSKKAFLSNNYRDIVWDQKIFPKSMFGSPYDVDNMFLDDLETQNEMKKANQTLKTGQISFFVLWGAAITYLYATPSEDRNSTVYYSLLIGSVVTSSIFQDTAERRIRNSIDKYNKKMKYTFTPYIYEEKQKRSFALGLHTIF